MLVAGVSEKAMKTGSILPTKWIQRTQDTEQKVKLALQNGKGFLPESDHCLNYPFQMILRHESEMAK